MAKLLYGSGLRAFECMRLRVKDLDFERRLIVLREGKGEKDRITMLPENVVTGLQEHLARVKHMHAKDVAEGYGAVYLPYALERKYPNGDREWGWQYVFPAKSLSTDPRTGLTRRHHLDESGLQKAVRQAARLAAIDKPVTCHTFRHSFATHLLETGYDTQHPRSGQVSAPSRSSSAARPALSLPKGRQDHHDLHPRPQPRPPGGRVRPRSEAEWGT